VEAKPNPHAKLVGGDWSAALQALTLQANVAAENNPSPKPAPLAVLVLVLHTQGSTPREAGAWMLVTPQAVLGTIGGGQLEWQLLEQARSALQAGDTFEALVSRHALGPSLGQCCGGVMQVQMECVSTVQQAQALGVRWQAARQPLALFGGGHVGRALVQALQPLPFAVRWVDSRDGVFPTNLPTWVQCEHSDPVHRAVADLPPHSMVLIMSFSHAEDLDVVQACLERQRAQGDVRWVGLIGSRTKWVTFRHRLEARGFAPDELDLVTCPIGLPGIGGKQPEVIAASVVAQLLHVTEQRAAPTSVEKNPS
jgi:xanthine dehydrogenase accessory factor